MRTLVLLLVVGVASLRADNLYFANETGWNVRVQFSSSVTPVAYLRPGEVGVLYRASGTYSGAVKAYDSVTGGMPSDTFTVTMTAGMDYLVAFHPTDGTIASGMSESVSQAVPTGSVTSSSSDVALLRRWFEEAIDPVGLSQGLGTGLAFGLGIFLFSYLKKVFNEASE